MSAAPLTGANEHQLTERKRRYQPTPREQIRAAWSKIDETRGIRRDQLDGMEEVWTWLARAARVDGAPGHPSSYVLRSVPKIVKGLGWEPMATMRDTQKRYRNQVLRRLRYLALIGWVESVEPVYKANGEGRGILIRLTPAGVAQSVSAALPRLRCRGASRTASAHPNRASSPVFSRRQVSAPLRESSACRDLKSAGNSTDVTRRAQVARARPPKSLSDARRRQIQGRMPAPRSMRAAAHGTEERRAEPLTEDQRRREAVRRQLALWNQQRGVITVDGVVALLIALAFIALVGWLA